MENKLTAIIIDDDDEAIRLLKIYLLDFSEIELVDSSSDPKKGLVLLQKKLPDIVFLDIDMPGLSGLSLADEMKKNELHTEVVFTTAHRHYAYQALSIEPLDYLVKPFGQQELADVIDRYHSKMADLHKKKAMNRLIRDNNALSKVKLPTKSGILFIAPDEIILLRSAMNNTLLFLKDGTEQQITQNINRVVRLINSSQLIRASRSAYINTKYLKKIEKKTKLCILEYGDLRLEEPINKASLVFFEKQNCFPIN